MRLLCFVVVAIAMVGCIDFEDNFVKIDSEPTVSIKSFALTDEKGRLLPDTFAIYGPETDIIYELDIEGNDTIVVDIFINNRYLRRIRSERGGFTLESDNYVDGVHQINFKVITNSGTGSLGELYSAELLEWNIERHFKISSSPAKSNRITAFYSENGNLKIEWENDTTSQKRLNFIYPAVGTNWEIDITDPKQISYIDNRFYVGGELTVRLTTIGTRSSDPMASTSTTVTLDNPNISEFSNDEHGNLRLSWNRPVFYNNVSRYTVSYEDQVIYQTKQVTDTTTITNKIPFSSGSETVVFRIYTKRVSGSDTLRLRTTKSVSIGQDLDSNVRGMKHAALAPEKGFLLNRDTKQLSVLNRDIVEMKFAVPISDSNGSDVVASDGSALYFTDKGKIYKADRIGNVSVVLDTFLKYGEVLSMNRLTIGADRYLTFANRDQLYMYDIVSQQPVFKQTLSNTAYGRIHQTPDGKFLIEELWFKILSHKLEGGHIVSTTSVSMNNSDNFYIDVFNGNRVVDITQDAILTYDPYADVTEEILMQPSDISYIRARVYDTATGLAGIESGDYFFVVDTRRGEVIRKVLIRRYTNLYRLYNGALYAYNKKLDLRIQ